MHSTYDSDEGDHVTYRNHESGLGFTSNYSEDLQTILWSKRGKSNARSDRNSSSSVVATSNDMNSLEFQPYEDTGELEERGSNILVNTSKSHDGRPSAQNIANSFRIKQRNPTEINSRDVKRLRVNNDTDDVLDIPMHWKDSSSRIASRPKARLAEAPTSRGTASSNRPAAFTSSTSVGGKRSNIFTTAALPTSTRVINASNAAIAPSRPSWLPKVVIAPNTFVNNSRSRDFRDDIVDDSFDNGNNRYSRNNQPTNSTQQIVQSRDVPPPDDSYMADSYVHHSPSPHKEQQINIVPSSTSGTIVDGTHHQNNRTSHQFYSSPSKSKHRSGNASKVGSLRWKFDKIMRDTGNLETFLSSPDIAMAIGTSSLHDPRSRVSSQLKVAFVSNLGIVKPFLALKVLVNTYEHPTAVSADMTTTEADTSSQAKPLLATQTIFQESIAGVYHALLLLKPNGIQENKLRLLPSANIALFDPHVVDGADITANQSILQSFMKSPDDGVVLEKAFLCSVWEVV